MRIRILSDGPGRPHRVAKTVTTGLLLALACLGLSACAGGGGSGDGGSGASLRAHPHELLQEVVRCENNGGALANTPHCRKVLEINRNLF
jgi:hypothetical protein